MDREYPREWFKTSRYSSTPRAKTFTRETERMLFWHDGRKERRETKSGRYSLWHPTREAAEADIASRKNSQQRKADAAEYADLAVKHCLAAGLTLEDLREHEPEQARSS